MAEKFSTEPSNFLLACPLEILEKIFSFLDPTSLFQLAKTCQYFKDLIEKCSKLWRVIDAREEPNDDTKTRFCIDRINKSTICVCLKGSGHNYGTIPDNFMKNIAPLSNLLVIALEKQEFDGSQVSLKNFPSTLEELSLKNSKVKHGKYFFKYSDNMQKLRVLILDGCRWMSTSYFKWISKYENLEILSAANCLNSRFYVAYIWNKDKCKRLRVVDYRFSLAAFGDDVVDAWSGSKPLHIAYFSNVASSKVDYNVTINYNANYYVDIENEITDEAIEKYVEWVFGYDTTNMMPQSYLYKDPYAVCTCNYTANDKKSTSNVSKPTTTEASTSSTCDTETIQDEGEECDWDEVSSGHEESEYMQSDDEYMFEPDDGKLKKCALRRLSLRGFKGVTDQSLDLIKHIELDLLDLTDTNVTQKGIEDYLSRYPNCRIVHSRYCTCKPTNPF